ncbi:MAG TPA: hypothetical protein VJT49_19425 [Amycolatopsis sp.]|uniref:hypothetical protein n=1 Tax=Amycolatopsis sp. TaxID=37632 RepID=UPI002B47356B|nr:hypothetical protein [Amycolatopsis sp.]HKS47238.1 hypothetical protein [Amycolatopsis sp.]
MGLAKVWVHTFTDGLIRADHIIGLSTHPTPALSGKAAHWLVDATLAVSVGSGTADGLNISVLHRTLIQTRAEPLGAIEAFAQLLARLHDGDPAGIITARIAEATAVTPGTSRVEFSFKPFTDAADLTTSGNHTP